MAIVTAILNILIVFTCLFLICLILIQRGKGGGLAGAFGGAGSSSAFGTKAGDVFTRVTIVVAFIWIILSMVLVVLYNQPEANPLEGGGTAVSKEVSPKSSSKAGGKTPPGLDKKVGPATGTIPGADPVTLPPAIPAAPAKSAPAK